MDNRREPGLIRAPLSQSWTSSVTGRQGGRSIFVSRPMGLSLADRLATDFAGFTRRSSFATAPRRSLEGSGSGFVTSGEAGFPAQSRPEHDGGFWGGT